MQLDQQLQSQQKWTNLDPGEGWIKNVEKYPVEGGAHSTGGAFFGEVFLPAISALSCLCWNLYFVQRVHMGGNTFMILVLRDFKSGQTPVPLQDRARDPWSHQSKTRNFWWIERFEWKKEDFTFGILVFWYFGVLVFWYFSVLVFCHLC